MLLSGKGSHFAAESGKSFYTGNGRRIYYPDKLPVELLTISFTSGNLRINIIPIPFLRVSGINHSSTSATSRAFRSSDRKVPVEIKGL